jgi:hypothetical protein
MWKNIPLKKYAYISILLNVAIAVTIFSTKDFLPPIVPLFYGLPGGINQLSSYVYLFIIPSIGLFIVILNILIARFCHDLFVKKALIIAGFFVSALGAITIIKIISLVGMF